MGNIAVIENGLSKEKIGHILKGLRGSLRVDILNKFVKTDISLKELHVFADNKLSSSNIVKGE